MSAARVILSSRARFRGLLRPAGLLIMLPATLSRSSASSCVNTNARGGDGGTRLCLGLCGLGVPPPLSVAILIPEYIIYLRAAVLARALP